MNTTTPNENDALQKKIDSLQKEIEKSSDNIQAQRKLAATFDKGKYNNVDRSKGNYVELLKQDHKKMEQDLAKLKAQKV